MVIIMKTNKKITVLAAMAITSGLISLSGCGASSGEAETTSAPVSSDISAETTETVSEIITESTSTEVSSDIETTVFESEETTAEETAADPGPLYRYCEARISTENVISSEEEFAASHAAELETAKEMVLASSKYAEDKAASIDDSYTFEPVFTEAITADFDRNGTVETFFFLTPEGWCRHQGPSSYLFRADDDGVRLISDEYLYVLDNEHETAFSEIVYNDFSHLFITVGYNNASLAEDIYSIDGSDTELKIHQNSFGEIVDGFMFEFSAPSAPKSWLIFWDNVDKCYKTPAVADLTDDQIADVPGLSEHIDADMAAENGVIVSFIGNKYYCIYYNADKYWPDACLYFLEDGTLAEADHYFSTYGMNDPIDVEDIDINSVVGEMQKLDR